MSKDFMQKTRVEDHLSADHRKGAMVGGMEGQSIILRALRQKKENKTSPLTFEW